MLSLKVKVKLNQKQQIIVETLSNEHRLLYNYLLSSIKEKSLTFKELNQHYKNYRNNNNLTISSKSAQNTCIQLINSIKSFYKLRKTDITVNFPYKFKSYKYFTSFMIDNNNGNGGFKIKDNILSINLNSTKNKIDIKLPNYANIINENNIKTLTFKKENNHYYIIFVYQEPKSSTKLNKDNFLSIDLGYSSLATCYSNKVDNISISNLKLKKLEKRIKSLQSLKDKKKKNSRKFKKINKTFKKVKSKQHNKIKDFQHKTSTKIIKTCIENDIGSLVVGDIKVKKIIDKNNHKLSGISKSTLALGRFKTFLEYKSKKVNIDFYKVNEAYTSQKNCLTGELQFSSDLSNRFVEVKEGVFINRDLNSAVNIAKKVKGTWSAQVDKLLVCHKMFVDYNSNLQMSEIK